MKEGKEVRIKIRNKEVRVETKVDVRAAEATPCFTLPILIKEGEEEGEDDDDKQGRISRAFLLSREGPGGY